MTTQASDATTNPAPGNQPPGNQAPENQPLDNPALANEPTGLAGRYVPQDPPLDEKTPSDGALPPTPPRKRHHPQRLRPASRNGPPLEPRPHPAPPLRRRMGKSLLRHDPA